MEKLFLFLNLIFVIFFTFGNVNCECDEFDDDEIQQTCPYTNEQVISLMNGLATYNDSSPCLTDQKCASNWMIRVNEIARKAAERSAVLGYNFETNVTDENNQKILEFAPIQSNLSILIFETGKKFYQNSANWNPELRRMLYLTKMVDLADPHTAELVTNMTGIYATTKITRNNQTYQLEPELTKILTNVRDYDEQLWAWKSWHDAVGPKVKDLFTETVNVGNEYIKKYGYSDLSEKWIEEFETENFEKIYDELFEQIKPFYQQLHAYVRRKLRNVYGVNKMKSKYLPAHLLGNMWAQDWQNIKDLVTPYPKEKLFNLTESLLAHKYTPLKLFKESQRFFMSLGLYPMTDTFWKYSMLEKPKDREVVCHASASDFFNGYDFRIKMCTEVTDEYFYIVHHEMGHIEYFMSYAIQPTIFRNGANSGFHEAIGDTVALSVYTPTHFKKIGLQNVNETDTHESQINFLMDVALKKIAFLPFGYLVDKWRWGVFRGKITPDEYNKKWWQMRQDYQGIESVEARNETYFDAGAKYHVAGYVPYARYYISTFLQFQFYKALCKQAGHTGPLHLCDFYGSKNAGLKLKEMLTLGSSKHWSQTLKLLTGTDKVDHHGILDYFKPLMDWLVKENNKHKDDPVGW